MNNDIFLDYLNGSIENINYIKARYNMLSVQDHVILTTFQRIKQEYINITYKGKYSKEVDKNENDT